MGKIHKPAGAAADKGAGEQAAFIEGVQDKRLAIGYAVNVNKGKGVIGAYAKRRLETRQIGFYGFHALVYGHGNVAAPQIIVGDGDAKDGAVFNHSVAERLQQHLAAIVGSRPIKQLVGAFPAQFAGSRHHNEFSR